MRRKCKQDKKRYAQEVVTHRLSRSFSGSTLEKNLVGVGEEGTKVEGGLSPREGCEGRSNINQSPPLPSCVCLARPSKAAA